MYNQLKREQGFLLPSMVVTSGFLYLRGLSLAVKIPSWELPMLLLVAPVFCWERCSLLHI